MHDMTELVADDRALLILVEKLEDALRDDDAGIGTQKAIGEGRRIAILDEADPRRLETILISDLVDELVHVRVALLHRRVVEKFETVEPAKRNV
jgi:hypothetical protein